MSLRLRCYTLFDITFTGITNRNKQPNDIDTKIWVYKRNTQCNFDTILQVISLRSQPEITSSPIMMETKINEVINFGNLYKKNKKDIRYWVFDFDIMHTDVFKDDKSDLSLLYQDCDKTPMIMCDTMVKKVKHCLDISDEHRNIYFEVLENEEYN